MTAKNLFKEGKIYGETDAQVGADEFALAKKVAGEFRATSKFTQARGILLNLPKSARS